MSRENVTLHHNICFQKVTYYTVNIPLIFCVLVLMGQHVYRLSVTFDCDVTATTHHKRPRLTDHSLAVLRWEGSSFSSVDITGMRRKGSTNI